LADDYLARTGYDSQQHDGPEDPNRPNNLWEPVAGDHGAHGTFDKRAHSFSMEMWLESHAKWLALAAGLTVAGATLSLVRRSPAAGKMQNMEPKTNAAA
jgi:hypothetical protein